MPDEHGQCELCGRDSVELTRHHLIPRSRHSNKRNKKRFDRQEIHGRLAMLCRPCHKTVHAVFSEKDLERHYNNLDELKCHPAIRRFVCWVRKQPPGKRIRVHPSADRQEG